MCCSTSQQNLIAGGSHAPGTTIIQGINLINHFGFDVEWCGYLAVFSSEQLRRSCCSLNLHESVVLIWGVAFALHLLVSGYLVYRSGYLPKWIGGLLIIASLCYFTQSFGTLLLPQFKAFFASLALLSIVEIALPLWLLIKGVNVETWKKRVLSCLNRNQTRQPCKHAQQE
jgi:hypothetical protein